MLSIKLFVKKNSVFSKTSVLNSITRCYNNSSNNLKEVLACKIPEAQKVVQEFRKNHGNTKVQEITVNSIYRGMRGLKTLIYETSLLDPQEGIRFRGLSVPECQEKLPRAEDSGQQPLPEALFWLLVTGDIPTNEQVKHLSCEWAQRAELPEHVTKFLDNIPAKVHPMSQLSAACSILNTESEFVQAYNKGMKKTQYWEYVFEDAMNLIAKLPVIAAKIYRNTFKNKDTVPPIDGTKDWAFNFCKMLGYKDPGMVDYTRLFLTINSDHEGGNVCAHTAHLVGSTLSDPYLSFAAGVNGYAGPLHGLANQEAVMWLLELQRDVGDFPTEEKIQAFIDKTLKSGNVIPGYGHAILRKTDPRFTCQYDFALKHFPEDSMVKIAQLVYKVAPPALEKLGKVQDPWPNPDAIYGVIFYHFGVTEITYYCVLASVSRSLGVMASSIWDKILGLPIERPKSITTEKLMQEVLYSNKQRYR